jgi:hypothetical protein
MVLLPCAPLMLIEPHFPIDGIVLPNNRAPFARQCVSRCNSIIYPTPPIVAVERSRPAGASARRWFSTPERRNKLLI